MVQSLKWLNKFIQWRGKEDELIGRRRRNNLLRSLAFAEGGRGHACSCSPFVSSLIRSNMSHGESRPRRDRHARLGRCALTPPSRPPSASLGGGYPRYFGHVGRDIFKSPQAVHPSYPSSIMALWAYEIPIHARKIKSNLDRLRAHGTIATSPNLRLTYLLTFLRNPFTSLFGAPVPGGGLPAVNSPKLRRHFSAGLAAWRQSVTQNLRPNWRDLFPSATRPPVKDTAHVAVIEVALRMKTLLRGA